MDERDCKIIGARYGLLHEEMTLQECGEALNITRERVRQIQARAEKRLRAIVKRSHPELVIEKAPDVTASNDSNSKTDVSNTVDKAWTRNKRKSVKACTN